MMLYWLYIVHYGWLNIDNMNGEAMILLLLSVNVLCLTYVDYPRNIRPRIINAFILLTIKDVSPLCSNQ